MSDDIKAVLPFKPAPCEGYLTLEIPAKDYEKICAYWNSEAFEQAKAAREARLPDLLKSLEVAVKWAVQSDCSGAATFARLLASLYNGKRVQMDASRLAFSLDQVNFEHAMNVIRLCYETSREPHSFFTNGNDLFERIIKLWGFEKKKRRSAS